MSSDLFLAFFIIAVGISVAGVISHLYQFICRSPVRLSYGGESFLASLGNLFISFICGPYIMLNLGFNAKNDSFISAPLMLMVAFIAFGWAFITGLFVISIYLAILTI